MKSILPKWCELSFIILLFAYLKTVACDSPDPDSSVFHPIISYDVNVISDNSSESTFIRTFVHQVCTSKTLADLFDIRPATATQIKQHAYNDFINVINENNLDDAEMIADFATRPIDQNFKVIPEEVLVRIYANLAANFLDSIGKLTSKNAEKLAKKYAKDLTKAAKKYVKGGDVESKFTAVAQGVIKFILSLQKLTQDEAWKVAFLYQSQFLLAAVEVGGSNDIYDQCRQEVDQQN
ncbi:uncharacterized protein NPIL_581201 [Nephila pilipes]|uniref:Uncharacterized protein n=1 Tax=Nephila pilipes TaxID=299642 RepID=A0A8X6N409_NEPPI|nr:uncharacterized protein NPIL_581201 [Nephila pilipes]